MRLKRYITEEGEEAGKMEIINTSLEDARVYIDKVFHDNGSSLDEQLPDFDKNFEKVKTMASLGHTKRKEMPVIDEKDVKRLQNHLKKGEIDIQAPFSDDTDQTDLFPEHLSGKEALHWLHNGKEKWDGDKDDDNIKVGKVKVTVGDLKPIQKQIYFDKSSNGFKGNTAESTTKFLTKSVFIVSSDNHIIDGHHRYLSAMLVDPKMKVSALKIDMPISQLLELSVSFGDAVGNKRNK